jgi:hypothetical protein
MVTPHGQPETVTAHLHLMTLSTAATVSATGPHHILTALVQTAWKTSWPLLLHQYQLPWKHVYCAAAKQ